MSKNVNFNFKQKVQRTSLINIWLTLNKLFKKNVTATHNIDTYYKIIEIIIF